jgi:Bacteriophage tail sheath protein
MAEIGTDFGSRARPRAPGVYLEEVAPERAPAFRTGVPIFVGFVEDAKHGKEQDTDRPVDLYALTRWEQFAEHVGRSVPGGFLEYAVRGFFENGGERCVVVPRRLSEDQRNSATLKEALKNLFIKDARGLRGLLEDIEDTDLVCVPDIMLAGIRASHETVSELQQQVLEETVFELQQQVLEYCKDMGDRFAILDALPMGDGKRVVSTPVGEKNIGRVIHHWQELLPTEGALYFPWVRVDPLSGNRHDFVPPCGHVAGVYARTDTQIGVHKAPANEVVEGVTDLEVQLTDEEQGSLNDIGVNCLRSFPGRGIRVWGARTLSGQPNWRYVNVRRLFLAFVRWVERNMHDLVFEPNGPPLWDRVRDRLGSYCYELFQRGALKGRSPDEAFFVKCDAETNPLVVREAGQLICDVGLAAITPAEFVVVRITQSAAGATATIPTGA